MLRPPKPDPLPVLGIMHEHNKVSDFVSIASLLEWQWHRIVMRNGQFYHPSRNGASWTAQCRKIPRLLPKSFYQVMHAQGGWACHGKFGPTKFGPRTIYCRTILVLGPFLSCKKWSYLAYFGPTLGLTDFRSKEWS